MQDQFSRDIFGDTYTGLSDPGLPSTEHRLYDAHSNVHAPLNGATYPPDFITDFINDPLAEFDDITRVGDLPPNKHASPQVSPGFHASRYEKKPMYRYGGASYNGHPEEQGFSSFVNGTAQPVGIGQGDPGVAPETVFGDTQANEPKRSILSAQLAQQPFQVPESWAPTSIAPSQMWAANAPKSGLSKMLSSSEVHPPHSAPVSSISGPRSGGLLDPELLGTPTLPGSFESNFIVNANAMTPVEESFIHSNYSSYSDRPMSPNSTAPFPRSESVSSFSSLNARPIDIVRSRRPSAQAGIAKSAGSRPHSRANSVAVSDMGRASTPTAKRASISADVQSLQCTNCHTRKTPLWRRNPEGEPLCNACGLFLKLHGETRPMRLKTDVIKKRNRSKRSNKPGQSQDSNQDGSAQGSSQSQKQGPDQNGQLKSPPTQQTPVAPLRSQDESTAQAATTPSQSSISPYVSSPDDWISPGVNGWGEQKSPRPDAPLTLQSQAATKPMSAVDDDKWNWLKMK